jgi:hypothetical protein
MMNFRIASDAIEWLKSMAREAFERIQMLERIVRDHLARIALLEKNWERILGLPLQHGAAVALEARISKLEQQLQTELEMETGDWDLENGHEESQMARALHPEQLAGCIPEPTDMNRWLLQRSDRLASFESYGLTQVVQWLDVCEKLRATRGARDILDEEYRKVVNERDALRMMNNEPITLGTYWAPVNWESYEDLCQSCTHERACEQPGRLFECCAKCPFYERPL